MEGKLRRPALRPGLKVVRRDDRHLQIGIGADRLLVADTPDHRALLTALTVPRTVPPDSAEAKALLSRLVTAGLVMDAARFRTKAPEATTTAPAAPAVAAVFAGDALGAPTRLQRRAGMRIRVDCPSDWREETVRLIEACGLTVERRGRPADVRLLATDGEPVRTAVDELVRVGEPHLLLANVEGRIRLGPFVVAGRTACLRCVDAHLAVTDPRRALIVEQYAAAEPGWLPEPCDPCLLSVALGWAVRDLVAWVDGETPRLWSSTVEITPGLELVPSPWTRHVHCGCSWGDLLAVG